MTTEQLLNQLLLEKDEVAALLRVSESTVDNLHRTNQLAGVLVGKHLRWRPVDVQGFVQGLPNGEVGA